MPQRGLSPEEFDVVYRRAIKQAPADLSQSEFDDYVHQQAQHEEAAKAGSVAPQAAGGLSFSPAGILGGLFGGVKGLASGVVNAVQHPIDTASNLVTNQFGQFGKAYDDYQKGHYSEMLGHTAAGALPIMGPAAADLGERTAETGDIGNALGEASIMSLLSSPSVMKPAVATAARAVKPAARALAATGRGVEAAGRFTGGEVSKLGGLATILHGEPVTGAALMAGPKAAEYVGSLMRRGGDSIASLKGEPGDWVTRQPPAPTHAELRAGGERRYTAGRAQQAAAERSSGVPANLRDVSPELTALFKESTPATDVFRDARPDLARAASFDDDIALAHEHIAQGMDPQTARRIVFEKRPESAMDFSADTDVINQGGIAPSHTPAVPQPRAPRNKFVTSHDVPDISEAQMQAQMASTPERMARAKIKQPTFNEAMEAARNKPSIASLLEEEAPSSDWRYNVDTDFGPNQFEGKPGQALPTGQSLPTSWQQFAGPEAELAAVRRNQTGRW